MTLARQKINCKTAENKQGVSMSRSELLEELKRLSNADRLLVIESATRLIREQLQEPAAELAVVDDPILRVAGCLSGEPLSVVDIERELYGEESA
jgi:GTP cyclohydrolase FolE2